MNFYTDNPDLAYYVERGIDWEPLVAVSEHNWKAKDGFKDLEEALEFYREVLDLTGGFIAREIAPYALELDEQKLKLKKGDVVEPRRLRRIFEGIKQLDLHSMGLPRELGGLNCPMLLYFINAEMFARADVSVMTHHSFHLGIAMALLVYSIREGTTEYCTDPPQITHTRFAEVIEEIRQGRAWGCMDITEPDAGSDMAAIRSWAEQDADGTWRVSGQKIFITSGHAKYHLVIARTERTSDPNGPAAGLEGLSMFLVPAWEEDANGERRRWVTIDRLEEKMGHQSSATCSLTFKRAPAQLIGERGQGFRYMLLLMNNARLGVAFESIGLCEAAWRLARDYAAQRHSMGKPIGQHEMIADYLCEMQTDIQGVRALAIAGAYHEEMAHKLDVSLRVQPGNEAALRRQMERHARKSRRITPLLKYLAAEKAVELAQRCIQIHGGVGYTREYGAEKLLRDAMVMPIYEGTSQIQSLMAMKDTLGGIMKNPQRFLRRKAQARWRSLSSRDPLERRLARVKSLSLSAQQHLLTRTATDKLKSLTDKPLTRWPEEFLQNWDPKRDFAFAMLHAERLTRLLADEVILEELSAQAQRHPERREVFERYLERAEPRVRFLHDEITTTGGRLLHQLAEVARGKQAG